MSENIYVSNATNVLKEVIVCSPKFYVFNAINEITKSWMEKGETEQNERMVAEWQTLVNAYRENGVIVHEVDAHKELEVQTFARDFGAMVKEGAIIGKFRHPARQKETEVYEQKLKELEKTKPNLKIACIIGPEGGLEEKEVETFKKNGAKVITLGNIIMRTETVSLNLLSIIMYEMHS